MNNIIRSISNYDCIFCGSKSKMLYNNLKDRLFKSQGIWNFRSCTNSECGVVWLVQLPSVNDISKAYKNYYTHQDVKQKPTNLLRKFYNHIKIGYWAKKYGYNRDTVTFCEKIFFLIVYLFPIQKSFIDFDVIYLKVN